MLLTKIKEIFQSNADPAIGTKQKAYMRDQFEFLGLKTDVRRALQKSIFRGCSITDEKELAATIEQLWEMSEREYQYCAIDLAKHHLKKVSSPFIETFEKMIRNKSWWDTVDDIAINLVGKKLDYDLQLMDQWIQDSHLWIRRSALICQIKWRKRTDSDKLFGYCRQASPEKDFFMRKAIGWALREYAKHHPEAVKTFLANEQGLSPLSRREACKHLK